MIWKILASGPRVSPGDILGFLPMIFNDEDPRPAREQANDRYAHGGGWRPQDGFKMQVRDHSIKYPGDPRLYVYDYGYVAVVQMNGKFEVARMD